MLFSVKCILGRIGGMKKFWEKKIGCQVQSRESAEAIGEHMPPLRGDSQIENRANRVPGVGGDQVGGRAVSRKKTFKNAHFFFRAVGSKTRGSPKCSKKVVFFWHTKCEKIEPAPKFYFPQKTFIPPVRTKMHFTLKSTFPIETIVKKNRKKIRKFPKFC